MLATGRSASPGPAGATPHGIALSDRSTVGETFGVTSLDQITASRQRSLLRSCGFSCHPDCCVMGPTLPREGFKASQSRRLGSTSDPGNHWAAIPAVLLGPDFGDEPLIHVLDGATGESWHQRYDGSCAPPGCSPLRQRRGARRRSPPGVRRADQATLGDKTSPRVAPACCRLLGDGCSVLLDEPQGAIAMHHHPTAAGGGVAWRRLGDGYHGEHVVVQVAVDGGVMASSEVRRPPARSSPWARSSGGTAGRPESPR